MKGSNNIMKLKWLKKDNNLQTKNMVMKMMTLDKIMMTIFKKVMVKESLNRRRKIIILKTMKILMMMMSNVMRSNVMKVTIKTIIGNRKGIDTNQNNQTKVWVKVTT